MKKSMLLLMFLFVFFTGLIASETIGVIVKVEGKVLIKNNGGENPAATGYQLKNGDAVVTAAGSRAVIVLPHQEQQLLVPETSVYRLEQKSNPKGLSKLFSMVVNFLNKKKKQHYSLALLDLNLPDATEGEVVDLVLSRGIPVVVFTSEINDEIREHIWSKKIVDYVLKEGDGSITAKAAADTGTIPS